MMAEATLNAQRLVGKIALVRHLILCLLIDVDLTELMLPLGLWGLKWNASRPVPLRCATS